MKNIVRSEYEKYRDTFIGCINGAWEREITRTANNTLNDIKCKLPISTKLMHSGIGVVVGKFVKFGENVRIYQNVTIENFVTVGDNVTIYPNSVLFNKITVGRNSVIGACSAVYKDVPPYSLVIGNCKIFKNKYKGEV